MNLHHTTATVVAIAVIVCLNGAVAVPAQATTDSAGGASATPSPTDIDEAVALRKMQLSHDLVVFAAERGTADRAAALEEAYVDRIRSCAPGERRPN